MKVSKHFSREEFACSCGCGFNAVDVKLLELLETIREHFDQPVTITSACRCESHNKVAGGADGSKHKLGIAADIVVKNVPSNFVQDFVKNHMPDSGGIGCYDSFTHVDVRQSKARWNG